MVAGAQAAGSYGVYGAYNNGYTNNAFSSSGGNNVLGGGAAASTAGGYSASDGLGGGSAARSMAVGGRGDAWPAQVVALPLSLPCPCCSRRIGF